MDAIPRLLPYLKRPSGSSRRFSGLLALAFASGILALVPAFLHRVLFDRIIPDGNSSLLPGLLVVMILVEASSGLIGFAFEKTAAEDSRLGRFSRRRGLADFLWTVAPPRVREWTAGLLERHFDDAAHLGSLPSEASRNVLRPAVSILLTLPAMVAIHPWLALIRLATIPPALWIGTKFLALDLACERKTWILRGKVSNLVVQGFVGLWEIKGRRAERAYASRQRRAYRELGHLEETRQLLVARWEAWASWLGKSGQAVSSVMAVLFVLRGELSFGSYIAFSIISNQAVASLSSLFRGIRSVVRTRNSIRRQEEVFLLPTENHNHGPDFQSLVSSNPEVGLDLRNVCFTYPSGKVVFQGANLTIRRGEKVLITGGSGAGKSTLLSLLLGFQQPDQGLLLWRGVPLPCLSISTRRRLVSAVVQEPRFFDGSLKENLRVFRPPAKEASVKEVLERSIALDFVRKLPGESDASLFGNGQGLSGGQFQRLALARLLLDPPELAILDEATNALDTVTAARVARAIEEAMEGRTLILIAHGGYSPFSIDRHFVLTEGGFKEQSHATIRTVS